jgi:hypothetical protein
MNNPIIIEKVICAAKIKLKVYLLLYSKGKYNNIRKSKAKSIIPCNPNKDLSNIYLFKS